MMVNKYLFYSFNFSSNNWFSLETWSHSSAKSLLSIELKKYLWVVLVLKFWDFKSEKSSSSRTAYLCFSSSYCLPQLNFYIFLFMILQRFHYYPRYRPRSRFKSCSSCRIFLTSFSTYLPRTEKIQQDFLIYELMEIRVIITGIKRYKFSVHSSWYCVI